MLIIETRPEKNNARVVTWHGKTIRELTLNEIETALIWAAQQLAKHSARTGVGA